MVESISFLKPAWCGNPLAGLRPEIGLTARYCSHRLPGGGLSLPLDSRAYSRNHGRTPGGPATLPHTAVQGRRGVAGWTGRDRHEAEAGGVEPGRGRLAVSLRAE